MKPSPSTDLFADLAFDPMDPLDLAQVLAIERASFRRPWTLEGFRTELNREPAVCRVARRGIMVLGYVIFWLIPPEIHVLNVAVRPDLRGRGLGRRLVDHMLEWGRTHQVEDVFLEVRPSNEPARELYEKVGFVTTGIRRGYYAEDNEDALVMTLRLTPERGAA
jgi:ribosomal-protein-alanine N-acetyltransferase